MSKIDDGGPAFPLHPVNGKPNAGMSLRDYAELQILGHVIHAVAMLPFPTASNVANAMGTSTVEDGNVRMAKRYADIWLAARKSGGEQ